MKSGKREEILKHTHLSNVFKDYLLEEKKHCEETLATSRELLTIRFSQGELHRIKEILSLWGEE